MHRLYAIAIDRPLRVLVLLALALGLSLPGLWRLRLRTDGRALVPRGSAAAEADRAIREDFGVHDLLAVVVATDDPAGVFNPRSLEHVRALTGDLQSISGVRPEQVTSLATEPGDTVFPGSLDFRCWLDPVPSTPEQARELERRLSRAPIYRGTLISSDSPPSAAAILVSIEDGPGREPLARAVREAATKRGVEGDRVLVAGAPLAESQLGAHLVQDLVLLVPIAFAVLGLILFLCLRDVWGAVLPLAGIGACLLATAGVLGWAGADVHLTLLAAPVILIGVGVAESIHVFDQVLHQRRTNPGEDPRRSLRLAMDEVARPVAHTSITTAIGFLSFAISPLPPMRAFGFATAAGVLVCMAWILTGYPACLALLGRRLGVRAVAADRPSFRDRVSPMLAAWTRAILARPRLVLAGACVLLGLALWGALHVRVQDSWIESFSKASELRRSTAFVDERFGGTHLLRLRVDAGKTTEMGRVDRSHMDASSLFLPYGTGGSAPPGAFVGKRLILRHAATRSTPIPSSEWRIAQARSESGRMRIFPVNEQLPAAEFGSSVPASVSRIEFVIDSRGKLVVPAILREVRALEEHLSTLRDLGVGRVIGPWTHLSSLNAMLVSDPDRAGHVLDGRDGIARTLELYEMNRGKRRLREVLAEDLDQGLVTVLLANASYETVDRMIEHVRAYEREHLAPIGLRLDLGGDLALSQTTIDGVVRTQIGSLVLSILGVLIATALMRRSIAAGIACALPCAAAALCTYGVMGLAGIPLGIATGMFAGITIGVGDDYAIHVWERMRRALDRGEQAVPAIVGAMADAGPAVLVDALAVGAGFSVLILSRVPTDARLGALLVLSIAGCLAATLTLLPPLLWLLSGRGISPRREA